MQRTERLLDIRWPQNHKAGLRLRIGGEISVLDVDARFGEPLGNRSQCPGFVVAFNHQDVVLESEHAPFPEDHEGLGRVAHHHADNGMIDRVGGGEGVDVDLRRGQLGADPGQGAGPIAEKNGELGGSLDLDVRIHGKENASPRAH